MRTIRIPFRLDSRGRIDTARSADDVLGQIITDLLVTERFERVFMPRHGANLSGFLFSPMLNVLMGSKADETRQYLAANIPYGEIVEVLIRPSRDESAVDLRVNFRVGPGSDVVTVTKRFTGVVTEETNL